jgi:hypothetical protein
LTNKAFIKLNRIENDPPEIEINWFDTNPGDLMESTIKSYINQHLEEDDQILSKITSVSGYIIYIYWNNNFDAGVALTSKFQLYYQEAILDWVKDLSELQYLAPQTKEELFEYYRTEYKSTVTLAEEQIFDIDWMEASLEGKTIELIFNSKEYFIQILYQFLSIFRWSFFFLDDGKITKDKVFLSFQKSVFDEAILYEDFYIRLIGEKDSEFNDLLNKSLINLISIPYKDQLSKFRNNLIIINKVCDETLFIPEKITIIKDHYADLIELDSIFTLEYLNELILSIAQLEPIYTTVESLFTIADLLSDQGVGDFAKLIEGTILEISLLLNPEEKEKSLIILTNRMKQWGVEYLIGFIRSITGILSSSQMDKEILSKLIDSVTDDLNGSWEGTLCLVETYILAEKYENALKYRFLAVELIQDKDEQSEDTLSALNSMMLMDSISDEALIDHTMKYLEIALLNLPSGEIFQHHISQLIDTITIHQRYHFLDKFVLWISKNLYSISLSDRLLLLNKINELNIQADISDKIKLKVDLLLFDQYLIKFKIENSQKYLEIADTILRSIYNNYLDPASDQYKQKLLTITKSIMLSSTKNEVWELLNDAKQRFSVMARDDEFAERNIIDIFIEAGRYRSKLDKTKLSKNDIGLRIYDEIIRMLNDGSLSIEKALNFLPSAKKLACNINDTKRFYIYSLLELKLHRILKRPWISKLKENADELLKLNSYVYASKLFQDLLNLNISDSEKYNLISIQLELASQDLDFLQADDILVKREKLIDLARNKLEIIGNSEIIDHYKVGVVDLLAKGDVPRLHDFLFNAIQFCLNKDIDYIEFTSILIDSYQGALSSYLKTGSQEYYRESILVLRSVMDLKIKKKISLQFDFVISILETNLKRLDKKNTEIIIIRQSNILRELGVILESNPDLVNQINADVKKQLIDILNKIFNIKQVQLSVPLFVFILKNSMKLLIYLEELNLFFDMIDKPLVQFKKSIIDANQPNSNLIYGLLLICRIYLRMNDVHKKLASQPLATKAIKLIDVTLSFNIEEENITQTLEELKGLFERNIDHAIERFNEEYLVLLNQIDEMITI